MFLKDKIDGPDENSGLFLFQWTRKNRISSHSWRGFLYFLVNNSCIYSSYLLYWNYIKEGLYGSTGKYKKS